jgi:regulator of replication initiation timing
MYARRFHLSALLVSASLILAACGPKTPGTGNTASGGGPGTPAAPSTDSASVAQLNAEKDSLLQQVLANTRVMSDISAELAKVKSRRGPVPQVAQEGVPTYGDSVLQKVRELTAQVNESEARIAASRRRLSAMTTSNDSLKTEIASLQSALGQFNSIISDQRSTIESMTQQINSLQEANTTLTTQNVALTDTVGTLVVEKHRVWYVIGTKDSLKAHGLITDEGSKFLFFGGKVAVPARNLDPSAFQEADRRDLTTIIFPDSNQTYRIVSRQDVSALLQPPPQDGKLKGGIGIADPSKFWAPSPYLIIMQD